jgi:uncharacterized protein
MKEITVTRATQASQQSPGQALNLSGLAMGTLARVELDPDPIYEKWILSGSPEARSKKIARSRDGASSTMVWECTAGRFRWHYNQDETLIILSGEAYLLDNNGKERHFAAGDYAFFPAGSVAEWRVDDHIRKIALLREPVWPWLVPVLKMWNKILRKLGFTDRSRGQKS